MKTLVEKEFGGDGQKVGVYLDDAGNLEVSVKYPVAKLLSPVNDVIDIAFKKVEDAIPGTVDDAILEPIKAGLKAEIIALLGA